MAALEIENLSFWYPGQGEPALKHVTLSVEEGDFVVLCGPSGGGKTTLLRQLKPALAPHGRRTGAVRIFGQELSGISQRAQSEKIGFVGQNPDTQTVCDKVWHELAFGLENLGTDPEEIRRRTAETAAFFGLEPLFYRDTDTLSGGQKQLLALAAVMVMDPRILLLDEPTAQLDPIAAENFLQAVLRLNRELGITVLMTEHRLEEVVLAADRLAVLENGRLLAAGEPESVAHTLKQRGSAIFGGLPAPIRIYGAVESDLPCPLSVREGREWLRNLDRSFLPLPPEHTGNIPAEKPVLWAKGLWFRYEKMGRDVLKNAEIQLYAGSCMAVLGGNGAGKSTLLSVLCGRNRPYRGTVRGTERSAAVLPQDPRILFSEATVRQELEQGLERPDHAREAARLCGIGHLLDRHPYDLSGGEQQRTALAKLLAREPEILFLDEPTKGMDWAAKEGLAQIVQRLKARGCAVLMVSHDVEFCASHADRCGLFFDGHLVSEDRPRAFFSRNRFYTTSACRMAAGLIPDAVTAEDVVHACGGEPAALRSAFSAVSPEDGETAAPVQTSLPAAETVEESGGRIRLWAVLATVFLLMPLTLLAGVLLFAERKYYFISTLLILEAFFPFVYGFEGRRPKARELAVIAALCGIGILSRAAFFMVPQFKAAAAVVILAGICFGGETGFLVGAVTMFASNIFFGQGPWTPWQMAAMGMLGALAGLVFHTLRAPVKKLGLAVFGFASVLVLYGGIMNPASVLMFQTRPTWEMFLLSYLQGLPFDLIHGGATALFLYLAGIPVLEKLERIKRKYGLLVK